MTVDFIEGSVSLRPNKPAEIGRLAFVKYRTPRAFVLRERAGSDELSCICSKPCPALSGKVKVYPLFGLSIEPMNVTPSNISKEILW